MTELFEKGNYIVYGATGVCKIADIRYERFGRVPEREYYIINPLFLENETIYAPVGKSEARMKKILSPEEAYSLIRTMPEETDNWIDDDNLRKARYSELLKKGDRAELVRIIKTLYNKKQEKLQCGKKFHVADERLMKEAEKLLYEELALIFNIKPDDVLAFITGELADFSEKAE